MKLQNMAVIFAIIVIPMTLILSAYIGIQIDTASLQQIYNTKLLDATHDAVVAFQLNSIQDKYSTNADSLRRDIKASINAFFTSLATNLGVPGENSNYISQYIPAVVFTLYDGYYIYSPIETEYTDSSGATKTKYEHALKPYIYYSTRYVDGNSDIVVSYSLDNYITVYGFLNGKYISRGGYLIAGDVADNGTEYRNVTITDEIAIQYYEAAKNFTNWVKNTTTDDGKRIGVNIVDVVKPQNALDSNGNSIKQFKNNSIKVLDISDNNDPEVLESDFTEHKREVIKQSIQSNLNNAICAYSEHTVLDTDFRMPVLSEEDWDKVLSNINIITFMQGLPVGIKEYNNYAIITSTRNKQYVDPELLYYIHDGDYHKIDCSILQEASGSITGYRSIAYDKQKDENGEYIYEHKELACYTCIVNSTTSEKKDINDYQYNIKQAYYNTLARERWQLYKPTVTVQTGLDVILDNVKPIITSANSTTDSIKFTATDSRTGIVGWTYTTTPYEPTSFTKCNNTKNFEYLIPNLKQNTWYYLWVIDAAGNISVGKSVQTKQVIASSTNITFETSNNNWTNQNITVTAKSNDLSYSIQLSKDPQFISSVINGNSITVGENGPVYARLVDSTGQSNGYATFYVTKIDKEKPQITETTATTNQVTISATDDASGIIGYAVTDTNTVPSSFTNCNNTKNFGITVTGLTQNKTYYAWVKDEAGNVSASKIFTTGQAVTSDGNITFTFNPSGWTNGNVTVTATSNVSGYIVQVSKNTTFPSTAIEVTSVTVSENQTVYARLVDSSNQSNGYASTAVTKIDKLAPTVSFATNGHAGWSTTNSTKITVSDNLSGIAKCYGRWMETKDPSKIPTLTKESDFTGAGGWSFNNEEQSQQNPSKGYWYLWVYVRDNAGNETITHTNIFYIDKIGPTGTIVTYNGGANTCSWKNNYNITLSSTDVLSGVSYYEIDWDGDGNADTTTGSNFVPWNGYYSCNTRFRAVDNVGNVGEWSETQHIHMDTEAPSKTTINLNGYTSGSWTRGDVTQTASATDNIGISYYQYSHDGTNVATFPNPWTINWDGQWNFYVRAVDYAGNAGAWSDMYTIRRDVTAPNVTFATNGHAEASTTNSTKITVSDNLSGIAKCYGRWMETKDPSKIPTLTKESDFTGAGGWSFNSEEESKGNPTSGYWYLWVYVRDKAGNETITRTNMFNLQVHSHTEACKHYHTAACYKDNYSHISSDQTTWHTCPSCGASNYGNQTHHWYCKGCNGSWDTITRYCHTCGYQNDYTVNHSCANSRYINCDYKDYADGAYVCGY